MSEFVTCETVAAIVDDTATFARGLRLAAERGEDVEFH